MNFGKQIRKFRKNARAISPVIATLLMIAIAVVASLVTYAWVMGYMSFQTEKTGKAIQIQSAANSTSAQTLTLYIQNVGDSAVVFNSNSVFINGSMVTITSNSAPTLAAGSTATIVVPNAQPAGVVSYVLDIKVTTTDGTFSTLTKVFP
jgi:archaeal type IV pilus assembly protein PilA